jgi:predicted nucleic acid-binding protein
MNGVLDSGILIEVLCGRKLEVTRFWADTVTANAPRFYSPVRLAEIRHSMREKEREPTERIFSSMLSVPIEIELARAQGTTLTLFTPVTQSNWGMR